jgi:hypothetical protein
MYEAFPGKLSLTDGRQVSAVFTLGDDVLTISAEGITVGTWPLKYCRVAPGADGSFRVSVDGEPTVFRPSDPVEFARAAAHRFQASPLSDRISVMRRMPPAVDLSGPLDGGEEARAGFLALSRFPLIAGILLVAVVVLVAFADFDLGRPSTTLAEPATVAPTESTAPVTTVPRQPAVEEIPDVFTLSAVGFAERWNEVAVGTEIPAIVRPIDPGPDARGFELPMGESVRVAGTLDADGTVGEYTVTVDADEIGDIEAIEHAIGALGVAVGVADPDGAPATWAVTLERLGLTASFQLDGIDREIEQGGVLFRLRYASPLRSLLLRVAPA